MKIVGSYYEVISFFALTIFAQRLEQCANDNIKILRSRRFKIAKKSRKYVTSCLVCSQCTYISLLYQFSCVLKQSDNNATRPSKDLGCTSKKISDFEICQNMQEIQILLGTCFFVDVSTSMYVKFYTNQTIVISVVEFKFSGRKIRFQWIIKGSILSILIIWYFSLSMFNFGQKFK